MLESSGYADIEITLNNVYSNLKKGGILYLKDLFLKEKESLEERENRIYWEYYWKFKLVSVFYVFSLAQKLGFKVLEFNNLEGKTNPRIFKETLELNLVKYENIHSDINFIESAEFVFRKE